MFGKLSAARLSVETACEEGQLHSIALDHEGSKSEHWLEQSALDMNTKGQMSARCGRDAITNCCGMAKPCYQRTGVRWS